MQLTPPSSPSALQQGISGLHQSQQHIVEAAGDLVRSGTVERASVTSDIVEPMVRIQQHQHVFDASANVVKVANETLGALIDTEA